MIVREPEAKFVPAPAGVHAAVCCDAIDMGLVANRFQPDAKPVSTVRLVWQIAEGMASGKPLLGVQPEGLLRVRIWNGEDPRIELERRIEAAMQWHGLTAADIGDRSGAMTEIRAAHAVCEELGAGKLLRQCRVLADELA